jgi:hypothetical protein
MNSLRATRRLIAVASLLSFANGCSANAVDGVDSVAGAANGTGGTAGAASGSSGTAAGTGGKASAGAPGTGGTGSASGATGGASGNGNGGGSGSGAAGAAGSGATPAPPCSSEDPAWITSKNWDYRTYDSDKLWIRNNIWGSDSQGAGTQTVWVNSPRCWGVTATHTNGNGWVKGYPQSVRGWSTGDGFKTAGHGMGIRTDALTRAMIHWSMEAPESGRFMALWDIYFHDKAAPPGSEKAQTSLMIFQRIHDDDKYFKNKLAENKFASVSFGGHDFKLEVTTASWASGKTLVLYLDPTTDLTMGLESMTLDLKAVIDGLVALDHISATNDYLTSIQIGWEIIDGGEYKTTDYWTALQDEALP